MKFEEFETLWAEQQPANVPAVAIAELKRSVIPELKRRSRMLGYGMFCVIFGVLIYPLLSIANYNYARPASTAVFWINGAVQMAVSVALLVYVVRQFRRHRALLRQSADTLRAVAALSLANSEAEMREYHIARWLLPVWFGFALLSVYLKFPVADCGWKPFALRAGMILGLLIPMSLVFWRHYRVNLKPVHLRQKEILEQLS